MIDNECREVMLAEMGAHVGDRNMEHIINTDIFTLKLKLCIFEEDIQLSASNTTMEVFVENNGFSGHATMDIDIKEFAVFSSDLNCIYETLSGEAKIEEPYGVHMYIAFSGDGRGHIEVTGYLHNADEFENEHSLKFKNCIDQTCLEDFCHNLQTSYSKYLY